VAQTLSVMNTDSELAVINAAGASRWTIARPILLLALAASVFSFVVDNGIDPYARQKNRQLIASSRADLLSLIIQEGTFRKIDDGLFLQIGERLPDNRLGGIFVADSREEGANLIYYAKSGSVVEKGDEKVLMMNDGVINRKSMTGDLSANAGSLELCVPDGVDLRIRLEDNALGSNNFAEAGLVEVGDTWTRAGVGSARIDLTASANLGSITLNPDDGCA